MSRNQRSPLVHVATMKSNLRNTSATPPQHLRSNQPLDDHGGAKTKTTWRFMTARILLAQSCKNIPKRK